MKIGEVDVGMIISASQDLYEGLFSNIVVPPDTNGIVVSILPNGRVLVEFELGEQSVSEPINCHPFLLKLVS